MLCTLWWSCAYFQPYSRTIVAWQHQTNSEIHNTRFIFNLNGALNWAHKNASCHDRPTAIRGMGSVSSTAAILVVYQHPCPATKYTGFCLLSHQLSDSEIQLIIMVFAFTRYRGYWRKLNKIVMCLYSFNEVHFWLIQAWSAQSVSTQRKSWCGGIKWLEFMTILRCAVFSDNILTLGKPLHLIYSSKD